MNSLAAEIQWRQNHSIVEVDQLSEVLLDLLLGAGQGQTFDALSPEPDQPLMLSNVLTPLGQLSHPL